MTITARVRLDIDTSNYLATTALHCGWKVTRQSTRYFTADKTYGGVKHQLGVSVKNGELKASRIEVVDTTTTSDQVVAWIEGRN